MKFLIGTDLEEVARFRRLLDRKPQLLSGLFFAQELEVAQKSNHLGQTLAGYWCAKESVVKAFAPILALDIREVEVFKDPAGYPTVRIHHPESKPLSFSLSISISHTRNYATATALLMLFD